MTKAANLASFGSDVTTPAGDAPIYSCRAWVNFNGTGTVAIRASGNVSSITDNGTGQYTVNFTTSMPDASYSVVANCMDQGVTHGVVSSGESITASALVLSTFGFAAITTRADMNVVTCGFFR